MSHEHWTTRRTLTRRPGWAERFNDRTLEIVIALQRITAILATFVALGAGFVGILLGSSTWLGLGAYSAVLALGAGYLGFWRWGNEEWRRGNTQ